MVVSAAGNWRRSGNGLCWMLAMAVAGLSASRAQPAEPSPLQPTCADSPLRVQLAPGASLRVAVDPAVAQSMLFTLTELAGNASVVLSDAPDDPADAPYPGAAVQLGVLQSGRLPTIIRADPGERVSALLEVECVVPGPRSWLYDRLQRHARRTHRRASGAAFSASDDLREFITLAAIQVLALAVADERAGAVALRGQSHLADVDGDGRQRFAMALWGADVAERANLPVLATALRLNAGQAALGLAHYKIAQLQFREAASAARAAGHRGLAAVIRNDQCILLRFRGLNARAAECYLPAIAQFRTLATDSAWARVQLANSLSGRSYALLQTGDLEAALAHSSEVDALLEQAPQDDPVNQLYRARIGLLSGDVERFRGRVEQALFHYQRSLELLLAQEQRSTWIGWTWLRLGLTQRLIDEPELARASLQHAIELPESAATPDLRGLTHLALGRLALAEGARQQAAEHFMRSWRMLSYIGHAEQAQAQLGLAEVSHRAASRFWTGFWLQDLAEDRLSDAALNRLSLLRAALAPDREQALRIAADVEARAIAGGDLLGLIDAAVARSRIELQQGDARSASHSALRALESTLALAGRISVPALRGAMLARSAEALDALIRAELADGIERQPQRILRLWAALEAVNAGALRLAAEQPDAGAAGDASNQPLPREIEGLAAAALLSQSMPANPRSTDLQMVRLLTRLHSRRSSPGSRVDAVDEVAVQLRERLAALDDARAVIGYFIAGDTAVAFVAHRAEVRLHLIDPAAARQVLALTSAGPDALEAIGARELAQLGAALVPAWLAQAGASELVLVGTGSMARFPFPILGASDTDIPQMGGVLDRFVLTQSPSALQVPAQESQLPAIDASRPLLALVDPLAPSSALPRLPGAREEGRHLQAMFGSGSARVLSGRDATVSAFRQMVASPHSVLHLGVHGLLDARRPQLSSLVLADEAEGPGLLPLQQLQRWRPQGSLLVLTACSSADGRVRRGEGTQSLARAFLQAGSPQVLAALWPIGDAASAEFSRYFYESLLASGRPATALAEAQRRMRDSTRWRQPVNWAGMVLYDALPAG